MSETSNWVSNFVVGVSIYGHLVFFATKSISMSSKLKDPSSIDLLTITVLQTPRVYFPPSLLDAI